MWRRNSWRAEGRVVTRNADFGGIVVMIDIYERVVRLALRAY